MVTLRPPTPNPSPRGGGETSGTGRWGSGSGDDGAGAERHSQYADTGGFQGGFEAVGEEDATVEEWVNPKVRAFGGFGMNG